MILGNDAEWSLPASAYRDPARFEAERKQIFAKNWLLFSWSERIPNPGDYVTGELSGHGIFAIRGDDGKVRAFHNLCRHRAAQLVSGETGSCGGLIVCPYHSWSYRRDGRLFKAVNFGTETKFDASEWGLIAADCEEWRGLVFVRLDRGGPSLVEWLGPVVDLAAPFPLERQHYFNKKERVVDVDWKIYGENYLECYHCRAMHPGLCATLDIDRYEINVFPEQKYFHLQAPGRSMDDTQGCYLYRFPFLMLNLYDWGSSIATVEPLGPGKLKHINWYFFEDISPEKAEENQKTADWSAQIITEDLEVITKVQKNINGGVFPRAPLSKSEEYAVIAFDRMCEDALRFDGPIAAAAE
ncbi:phenylpropionate dioxygenase-like ring-hydroxylating dioxygenase large terminal subunit [Angulomicrobium tetraedrale]|uniref:Phenylpropionate dioxygenase-like ring-hydroxylating dioxygenase large terminal subunit n=1 Tax=Ancylobacter tetraedralis TaxID=217068 RepID=A0A839ZBN9_9HYPH|nr:aromatic ring-hydroxylating dioxygenase subunit alpha [Ancylobacter tetraedralis]MBB3772183.1 phenylpropionate dioxygenase-like ring-hydroxylating dioxygenase large terminal subunit [Ancylobacter tetraedralis]